MLANREWYIKLNPVLFVMLHSKLTDFLLCKSKRPITVFAIHHVYWYSHIVKLGPIRVGICVVLIVLALF
jgi:hypothetical protein